MVALNNRQVLLYIDKKISIIYLSQDGSIDFDCQLRNKNCQKMLHIWTVGLEDFCQADYKAFRFGKEITTWVSIQYHWNNPQLIADATGKGLINL